MRTLGTLLSYLLGVTALIGAVVVAISLLPSVAATTPQSEELSLSSSPRIAAWQERIAEEKVYAERERARVAEEKARWTALGKPPVAQAVNETRTRELEEREQARARQAQRETQRRAQQAYVRKNAENAFAYAPGGYAPASRASRYDSIYSTMRDAAGL
jgi:hypothetical protein